MRASVEAFAGLLDRSVREIAGLAADGRTFDLGRIGRIADMWHGTGMDLVSAACALRPLRAGRATVGLRSMAALAASRRALMVELDPALDGLLPAAVPADVVHRDFQARVCPGIVPVTAQRVAELAADYDLADATVRSLAVQPERTGLEAVVTLTAPRRFAVGDGRRPWPAARLRFFCEGVTDLRFDAEDRGGAAVTCAGDGVTLSIGRGGVLRATSASMWPDDPMWHESAAGRAADAVTPRGRPSRERGVPTWSLGPAPRAAALALADVMIRIRTVDYYPDRAGTVPVRELCHAAADAGSAVLAAAAAPAGRRRDAFTALVRRWQVPDGAPPEAVPAGPAVLRYARYTEPHEHHDIQREGSAVLAAAVPAADPAAPWRLTSEQLAGATRFQLTSQAFAGVHDLRRDADTVTAGDALLAARQR
ncbi:hypothetical protein [Dactylosporangium sp. NPDC000521]|uniref:hypothetical protein n=1 Tax=Dactylosporangium sp. NPDC000521 TaxID=3363975 RepID=UPI0036A51625